MHLVHAEAIDEIADGRVGFQIGEGCGISG